MFEVQNYLKNWIGKIVVCEVSDEIFPHWKTEREKYIYDGTITNQNMRQLLPHEIIIEFDLFPGCDVKDDVVRKEAVHWITLIKTKGLTIRKKIPVFSKEEKKRRSDRMKRNFDKK